VLRCLNNDVGQPKVQQAACDALFNIIKIVKEAILRDKDTFKSVFDAVLSAINNRNETVEWAKKVDDLLKNQVYAALSSNYPSFDLDSLINMITEKLAGTTQQDTQIVLIKWLEVLHSI
jgi:hypothetical protein